MQAGLIFYQAHRTFENKITGRRFLSSADAQACRYACRAGQPGTFCALSTLLHTCELCW